MVNPVAVGSFAAVILAAGAGARLGRFKPLAELNGSPVVERAVALFRSVDVPHIVVVAGHRADELAAAVRPMKVTTAVNPDYRRGMFSSVIAGIRGLPTGANAFFLLPVDIPLVRPATLRRLIEDHEKKSPAVCYPTFQGKRGHPPLISTELTQPILDWSGEGGLRACLKRYGDRSLEVPTADAGILQDMDTPEDYEWMKTRVSRLAVPTAEECEALMADVVGVDDPIRNHCRTVAGVALALVNAFNIAGRRLDAPLIEAAALVHDVARTAPNHAQRGADLLTNMGFPDVADVVASHMDLKFDGDAPIGAREILFLSDKLATGDRLAPSLAERFRSALDRFGDDPVARAAIRTRWATAEKIREKIEAITGRTLSDLLSEAP